MGKMNDAFNNWLFKGTEQTRFYSELLAAHLNQLTITSYKALRGVSIDQIARINLIAGLNNAGKTTFLEAVYLLCRQNDFSGLYEIQRRRSKVSESQFDVAWFCEQMAQPIAVEGVFNHKPCAAQITPMFEEDEAFDKAYYLKTIRFKAIYGDHRQSADSRLFERGSRQTKAASITQLCPSVFTSSFFLNEPFRYSSFYQRCVKENALPQIIDFIRNTLVPTLTDIRLVDEHQRFLVSDSRFETAMDLTEYGEGLQRIFFLSLLFASAKNGVLLIDEFENALHVDLIAEYVGFVVKLAERFNVQVFLTTHSKECIDAFVTNLPDGVDFSACALIEKDGGIQAKSYSGKTFRRLVEAGNVDLRRAR